MIMVPSAKSYRCKGGSIAQLMKFHASKQNIAKPWFDSRCG